MSTLIIRQFWNAAPAAVHALIAAIVLLAAGAAHFAGFLSNVPGPLRPLVATSMATVFFATFLFYVGSIYIVSRVAAQSLIAGGSFLHYLFGRLSRKPPIRRVKDHLLLLDAERWLVYVTQAGFFIYFFLKAYLDVLDSPGYLILLGLAFTFIVVSVVARVWRLASFKKLSLLIRGQRRSRLQLAILRSVVALFAGVVIVFAYLTGSTRHGTLWSKNTVFIQEPRFAAPLNLILRSGNDVLVVEHNQMYDRHVLITPTTIIYEIVDVPAGSPQFNRFLPPSGG